MNTLYCLKQEYPNLEMALFSLELAKSASFRIYCLDTKEEFIYTTEYYNGCYRVVT